MVSKDLKDFAFYFVVESNNNYIDKNKFKRLYEDESIRCFKKLRKFYNNDIFVICITKNDVSENTKKIYKDLNITYIFKPLKETKNFYSGFYNKVLGSYELEKMFSKNYKKIIALDLDMFIIRYLNFDNFKGNNCLIYDEIQKQYERKFKDNRDIFNTCFIVTDDKEFFKKWWNILKNIEIKENVFNLDKIKIEEYSFDILAESININKIQDIIFGETYTEIEKINLKNTYFHHYHIGSSYNFALNELKFLKLLKRTKN